MKIWLLKTSQIFLCFGRCFIIKQELPINRQIREKEVQVIDENGNTDTEVVENETKDENEGSKEQSVESKEQS